MSAFNTELLVKLGLELCHSCVLPCVAYKPLLASMGFCLENNPPQKRGVNYIKNIKCGRDVDIAGNKSFCFI